MQQSKLKYVAGKLVVNGQHVLDSDFAGHDSSSIGVTGLLVTW